jgi:hypothetical protein
MSGYSVETVSNDSALKEGVNFTGKMSEADKLAHNVHSTLDRINYL